MSTDLVERRGFDLTRAPSEQWNEQMLEVVTRNVFRGQDITQMQLYYCMSVAEGLGLNPMIGEIYFLPARSKDAKGPAWTPYVGRNGLVKKAAERAHHYEAETVCANDRFRMTRKRDGTVEVTHSYTQADRGEIVGAYAFLHDDSGVRKPAFFYAALGEYLPEFDAEWKMAKSSWGNQRSAMIEKCAMIGAGRKRLKLGNVLADGEIDRVQQQSMVGPGSGPESRELGEFDWGSLKVPDALRARLQAAVDQINEVVALSWTPARLEMVTGGMTMPELEALAGSIEAEAKAARARVSDSPESEAGVDQPHAEGPGSAAAPESGDEGIQDAVVVVDADHVAGLQQRLDGLGEDLNDPLLDPEHAKVLQQEFDKVERELAAARDPGQTSLGL